MWKIEIVCAARGFVLMTLRTTAAATREPKARACRRQNSRTGGACEEHARIILIVHPKQNNAGAPRRVRDLVRRACVRACALHLVYGGFRTNVCVRGVCVLRERDTTAKRNVCAYTRAFSMRALGPRGVFFLCISVLMNEPPHNHRRNPPFCGVIPARNVLSFHYQYCVCTTRLSRVHVPPPNE